MKDTKKNSITTTKNKTFAEFLKYHLRKNITITRLDNKTKKISLSKLHSMKTKKIEQIKKIIYNEPGILEDCNNFSLASFTNLKNLELGENVTGVKSALPSSLKKFHFKNPNLILPRHILTSPKLEEVIAPDYSIRIPKLINSDESEVFIDEDKNLNITKLSHISDKHAQIILQHDIELDKISKSNIAYLTNNLLEEAKYTDSEYPIAIYADPRNDEKTYGIHAIVNTSKQPFKQSKDTNNNSLIAFYYAGEFADLSELNKEKFPNLSYIVISPRTKIAKIPTNFREAYEKLNNNVIYKDIQTHQVIHFSHSTIIQRKDTPEFQGVADKHYKYEKNHEKNHDINDDLSL